MPIFRLGYGDIDLRASTRNLLANVQGDPNVQSVRAFRIGDVFAIDVTYLPGHDFVSDPELRQTLVETSITSSETHNEFPSPANTASAFAVLRQYADILSREDLSQEERVDRVVSQYMMPPPVRGTPPQSDLRPNLDYNAAGRRGLITDPLPPPEAFDIPEAVAALDPLRALEGIPMRPYAGSLPGQSFRRGIDYVSTAHKTFLVTELPPPDPEPRDIWDRLTDDDDLV